MRFLFLVFPLRRLGKKGFSTGLRALFEFLSHVDVSPLLSTNLHFSNKSQGLSLSIPLWRFAIFSSTNPCALWLQNSYVHLPSQRIKVTLQEWVWTSVFFMSSQVQPLPHSLLMLLSPLVRRCPQNWIHGGNNVGLLLIQMPRSHQQLVSWGTNHQDVSTDSGNLSLTHQKPFLSLLFLF